MRVRYAAVLLILICATAIAGHASAVGSPQDSVRPVMLTGEVVSADSQPIPVPPSNSSPVVLRNFVADGVAVKAGDLVLRIEAGGIESVSDLQSAMETAASRAEREAADLEVKAVEAEKAVAQAQAALAKAQVDAALPKAQISIFDYDRYRAERDRAERDLQVKQMASDNAAAAVANRRKDGELEQSKLRAHLLYVKARLVQSEVHAQRDGVVVHAYSVWNDERFDEGSSAFPGNVAGQVIGAGPMSARAWAIEADRPQFSVGQAVRVEFDALPGASAIGHVRKISGAPEKHAGWGRGRYFRIDIDLPAESGLDRGLALVSGMSVLVLPQNSAAPGAARQAAAAPAQLTLEGEVASSVQTPIAPPAIRDIWQYTLAQLAPEGSIVEAGQPVATFEAADVSTRLQAKRSELKEKQRALEKLRLDQADAERSTALAVQEAQSNADRAERKARMPKELIRRVDYDKLVIERALSTQLAAFAVRERDAHARARKAELDGTLAEIAQIEHLIALLEEGQQALTVKAQRRGVVLYRNQFSGEKFTVGSQVWMGLSVATLADPVQLIVNAKVPEAQAQALRSGQAVRIIVPGANLNLVAHITSFGRTFHGKSSSQPIVVRDVTLQFDSPPKGVKPGTAVQVSIATERSNEKTQSNIKEASR
jgi:multidrug resistance efflux pump